MHTGVRPSVDLVAPRNLTYPLTNQTSMHQLGQSRSLVCRSASILPNAKLIFIIETALFMLALSSLSPPGEGHQLSFISSAKVCLEPLKLCQFLIMYLYICDRWRQRLLYLRFKYWVKYSDFTGYLFGPFPHGCCFAERRQRLLYLTNRPCSMSHRQVIQSAKNVAEYTPKQLYLITAPGLDPPPPPFLYSKINSINASLFDLKNAYQANRIHLY